MKFSKVENPIYSLEKLLLVNRITQTSIKKIIYRSILFSTSDSRITKKFLIL